MTDEMIEEAKEMYASGEHSAEDIARALGVSRSTIFRIRSTTNTAVMSWPPAATGGHDRAV